MREIIGQIGCTKMDFAKICEVSRVTVDKWCKGSIPKNRETFLKIGMEAHYDVARMNQLQRYGRYPSLHAKSLEDCVCIFVLQGQSRRHGRFQNMDGIWFYIDGQGKTAQCTTTGISRRTCMGARGRSC